MGVPAVAVNVPVLPIPIPAIPARTPALLAQNIWPGKNDEEDEEPLPNIG